MDPRSLQILGDHHVKNQIKRKAPSTKALSWPWGGEVTDRKNFLEKIPIKQNDQNWSEMAQKHGFWTS